MVLGVYSDDNGVPDANLAVTDTTAIDANPGWQTVQLTSPVDVNEGDTIWLAWVFETNPGTHYRAVYPTARYAPGQRFEDGMPTDFGTSSSGYGMKFSIHAVYTPKAQPIELLGNPYMFTGRRFDLEILRSGSGRTGLYYYRARYYNPEIGRFLQTDPIGYGDGMNWYNYCGNNPASRIDPSGLSVDWTWYGSFRFLNLDDDTTKLTFQYYNKEGEITTKSFESWNEWEGWALDYFNGTGDDIGEIQRRKNAGKSTEMPGSRLAGSDDDLFWELQKMAFLCRSVAVMLESIDDMLESTGQTVTIIRTSRFDSYDYGPNILYWNEKKRGMVDYSKRGIRQRKWHTAPAMVGLAHELQHCYDDLAGYSYIETFSETRAMSMENNLRYALFEKDPSSSGVYPRPGLSFTLEDIAEDAGDAWRIYWRDRGHYPIW